MSSIDIIVADLNKQERTHRFSPLTRIRDVRSHYPHYGTGVFLYYCMVKMDADKSLSYYDMQNGCKVEFRMWFGADFFYMTHESPWKAWSIL